MDNSKSKAIEQLKEILDSYEETEKKAEYALRYAQGIIETIREPFLVLTEDLKVSSVSKSFYAFFRVTPDETIGRLVYELGARHFDIPELRTLLERVLPNQEKFDDFEIEFEFPTIGKKTLLLNARQIAGYPKLVLLAIEDTTIRKQIHAHERDEVVKSQYRYKELERLTHIIAHDIRSPLVNIEGFSSELLRSSKELHAIERGEATAETRKAVTSIISEHIPEAVQYIQDSVHKIDQLLLGLKTYLQAGTVVPKIETVDMNELLQAVIGNFKIVIDKAETVIHIDSLPNCLGDKMQINQVFSNLLDNAIKYRDPARKGYVQIRGKAKGDRSIYVVEDNGIGIPIEQQGDIFTMFFRVSRDKVQGQGIGLAACKQILERQNGRIWLESEPGKASRFFVSLPRAD